MTLQTAGTVIPHSFSGTSAVAIPQDGQIQRHALPQPARIDVLARVPVPLTQTFRDAFDLLSRQTPDQKLSVSQPIGDDEAAIFGDILAGRRPLPDLILSTGTGDLAAIEDPAHFQSLTPVPLPPRHAACGLADPAGIATPLALIPFVFLVDAARLGDLPLPSRWADLLNPLYAGKIVFGGWKPEKAATYDECNRFFLAAMLRDFGEDGIKSLAANVAGLMHTPRMPRMAGTGRDGGGAIYILPWFFAEICPRRSHTRMIWPQDGALVMPIYLLARRGLSGPAARLADYLLGDEFGMKLMRNCYPPAWSHQAQDHYPLGAALKWMGWNAARGPAQAALTRRASDIFFAHWQEAA